MDDDDYSWVRRTRFTHSIVRSSSGRSSFDEQFDRRAASRHKGFESELRIPAPRTKAALLAASARPSIPRARNPNDGSSDTLEFSFHSEEQSLKLQRVCSSPGPFAAKDDAALTANSDARSVSLRVAGDGSKPKKRAKSPIPTRVISDVFREAKAASKRFSSPQRPRKSGSARFLDDSPPFAFSSTRVASKLVTKRASSWPRNSDNRVTKVAALEILERGPWLKLRPSLEMETILHGFNLPASSSHTMIRRGAC